MRKIIFFTLILMAYNFFLLILPVVFFICSLSFSRDSLLNAFPWFYGLLALFSPVLAIVLGYRSGRYKIRFPWLSPILISWGGFLPLLFFYALLNSVWNLTDYCLLFFFPVSLGLLADLAVWIRNYWW